MQQNKNFEKEEISIKELFFIIRSNIKSLILFSIISLLLGFVYLVTVRPVYKTSGSIIIDDQNSTVSSIFDMGGLSADKNYLENEIEVLKSRTTSERTIKSLLNSPFKNSLHLFSTKEYDDKFLRKTFRNFLFLDWNHRIIRDIDTAFNDSLFNVYTDRLRDNISISNLDYTDVLRVSYS